MFTARVRARGLVVKWLRSAIHHIATNGKISYRS